MQKIYRCIRLTVKFQLFPLKGSKVVTKLDVELFVGINIINACIQCVYAAK